MLLVITLALTSILQTVFNVDLQANVECIEQAKEQALIMPYAAAVREQDFAPAVFTVPACTENL